jgi:alpha-beta hydrolase superfamily lysophospholipase
MENQFLDSADGTRLRTVRWGAGARDLLVVPGLAEHAGRYEALAESFAGRGWRVVLLELRGHGHSGGRRGHVDAWERYTEDVRAAAASLRTGWSMLAHSMGGLVALEAVRTGLTPARLALTNPLLGVRVPAPRIKIAAAGLLSRLWPTLPLGNELKSAWLSRDAAVGRAYDADPLVYGTITPRWYSEMLAAQQRVLAASYTLPLAFFLAPDDPITDTAGAKRFAERLGAPVREYPGMLHEPFNEIGKEQVLADVAAFLEA